MSTLLVDHEKKYMQAKSELRIKNNSGKSIPEKELML